MLFWAGQNQNRTCFILCYVSVTKSLLLSSQHNGKWTILFLYHWLTRKKVIFRKMSEYLLLTLLVSGVHLDLPSDRMTAANRELEQWCFGSSCLLNESGEEGACRNWEGCGYNPHRFSLDDDTWFQLSAHHKRKWSQSTCSFLPIHMSPGMAATLSDP